MARRRCRAPHGNPLEAIKLCVAAMRRDPYWRARALAAHALYDMAWEGELRPILYAAIPELAEALRDESNEVRLNAVYTLELLASGASTAIPALREAAEDADDEFRRAAKDALAAIPGGTSGNGSRYVSSIGWLTVTRRPMGCSPRAHDDWSGLPPWARRSRSCSTITAWGPVTHRRTYSPMAIPVGLGRPFRRVAGDGEVPMWA